MTHFADIIYKNRANSKTVYQNVLLFGSARRTTLQTPTPHMVLLLLYFVHRHVLAAQRPVIFFHYARSLFFFQVLLFYTSVNILYL